MVILMLMYSCIVCVLCVNTVTDAAEIGLGVSLAFVTCIVIILIIVRFYLAKQFKGKGKHTVYRVV